MSKNFNIALIAPQIPQNTGNIGRLCVNTDTALHLVKPLGFSLEDKYIKRAGMDYWQYLNLTVHDSLDAFLRYSDGAPRYFFSTKTSRTYYESPFENGAYLIFGNEGGGFPDALYENFRDSLYTIPMRGKHARSLNLANSAAIVLYEGLRP